MGEGGTSPTASSFRGVELASTVPARVLFVSACAGKGGAGHSLKYLCEYVDRSRVEPIVVLPNDGVIGDRLREIGVPTLLMPRLRERFYELRFEKKNVFTVALSYLRNAFDSIVFTFQLAGLARKHDADLIYGNHMMVKIMATVAGLLSGRRVVLHTRTIYSNGPERWLYTAFGSMPHVKRIVAVSRASAENFRAIPEKVRVVWNGVPIEEVRSQAGDGDALGELGVPAGMRTIGFVGRLVAWKGVDVFLDAAEVVGKQRDDVAFVLIGDVPTGSTHASLDDYRAEAAGRGLEGRIFFAGFQSNPARFVRQFHAVAVPSVSPDPCPRVVIEAMALGTPVIGTNHGGIPEQIEHEESGMLVPPRDAAALAEAMLRLLDDRTLHARIVEAADERVRENHDADGVAQRIQAVILEAVGRR